MSSQWTPEEIRYLLSVESRLLVPALLSLRDLHVKFQSNHLRGIKDGIGFSQPDTAYMLEICRTVSSRKRIPEEHLQLVFRKVYKYAKQLTMIANNMLMGRETPEQLDFIYTLELSDELHRRRKPAALHG